MSDAVALAEAIAAGRTSASAAMEASLEAASARASLGAIARLAPELGRAAAAAADAAPRAGRGPLHGVPFLAKDLGAAARGLAPAAGSPALRRRVSDPDADSDLFARFRAAGLATFGLSAAPEFGLALSSEPPEAAPARNPFDPGRTPGGSSGGAAAAVAAGIVAIAHATDAAGSIRVPAACCGLYGLKPSRGAVPQGPDFGNYLMGLASELVLARSLRDVTAAFDAAAEPRSDGAPSSARVGLALSARRGPAERDAARAAADVFERAGAEIVELPALDPLGADCAAVARRVLSVSLAEWLDACGVADAEISPIGAAVAEAGRRLSGASIFAAAREIAQLSDRAAALFDRVDAVLSPVLCGPPPPLGWFDPSETDAGARFDRMEATAPNATIANVAGLPALAFPFGMADGLPLGLQLSGPIGSDRRLLALVARIEADLPPIPYPHPIAGLPQ